MWLFKDIVEVTTASAWSAAVPQSNTKQYTLTNIVHCMQL